MNEDKVITQAEAGRLLGVSRQRIEQMIDQGQLRPVERQVTVRYLRQQDVLVLKESRPARPAPPSTEGVGDDVSAT